jgi:DNA mismatch repair protein MLH3
LYDEINRLFSLSSFGTVEDASDIEKDEKEHRKHDKRYKNDGFTNRQLKGARKGIDKWPMFSLRITLKERSAAPMSESSLLESEGELQSIIEVLRAMLTQWLSFHHFRPRKQRTAFDRPLSASPSPSTADWEQPASRDIRSFLNRTNVDPEGVRASTPNKQLESASRKRKRVTPSNSGSATRSRSNIEQRRQTQPFTEWSRIKSGNSRFYDTLWNAGRDAKKGDSLDVPIIDVSIFKNDPILAGSLVNPRALNPSWSLEPATVASKTPPITFSQNENDTEPQRAHLDETITWTNPSTKQTFLANARTGCVVSGTSQRPQTDPSISSKRTTLADFNKPLRLRQRERPATTDESSTPWLDGVLNNWDNPVFKQAELRIPQVSLNGPVVESAEIGKLKNKCGRIDIDKAFKEASHSGSSRLSKHALQHATVIAQIDKKFILVKMKTAHSESDGTVLVLMDQHAADERIRVEALLADLCTPIEKPQDYGPFRSNIGHESRVRFTVLPNPLTFSLTAHETELFRAHAASFAAWGILYNLTSSSQLNTTLAEASPGPTITVTTLPPAITARCKAAPPVLIALLRAEVYNFAERKPRPALNPPPTTPIPAETKKEAAWLHHIGTCPPSLLDLVNSRACRSAVMFNDVLSTEECEELVLGLGRCVFPFQCAHGRPTLVPLVELGDGGLGLGDGMAVAGGSLGLGGVEGGRGEKEAFGEAFRKWKEKEGL